MAPEPKTLQEAVLYFSDPENCFTYLVARRPEWKNGVTCPTCGGSSVSFLKNQLRWQCASHHAKRQFSVKVGTIFEDSAIGLDKWLVCVWLVTNCKNGISSWEIHRALGVTQKTAWFMLHRLRLIMRGTDTRPFAGEVEADETFVGGKSKNMHIMKRISKQLRGELARGVTGKAIVMGLLDRNTKQVRTTVIPERKQEHLHGHIKQNVEPGSKIYTDELVHYENLPGYAREFINHTETYVRGSVHTNCLENFWSLLKRGLNGTYVSVEPFHLQAYVDEQAFRYNNRRDMNDAERFSLAVSQIVGKRLTYADLTGKSGDQRPEEPF
jgi:transposase-like protein